MILPIGSEPSGTSWTGFQSLGDGEGYVCVCREYNAQAEAELELWSPGKNRERILGSVTADGSGGGLTCRADNCFSYGLFRYS